MAALSNYKMLISNLWDNNCTRCAAAFENGDCAWGVHARIAEKCCVFIVGKGTSGKG